MHILFDVFMAYPEKANNLSTDERIAVETIYVFVEDKIKVLKGAIDTEEEMMAQKRKNGQPNTPIGIVIELKKQQVSFYGYSEALTKQLHAMFTDDDVKNLAGKLVDAFNHLN